ncbi:MAG: type II toxin-antitoxin system VapC family toxin [Spirochaetota bacterium]
MHILDCSFTAALFLSDEKSESVTRAFAAFQEGETVAVPQLWWYEMGSVLTIAVKRRRLSHSGVVTIIGLLKDYGLETDQDYGESYVGQLFELSQLYGISSYDAAYLELAIRKQGRLATLDGKLADACKRAGVGLVDS